MKRTKIVVILSGGNIQNILCSNDAVEINVVDFDNLGKTFSKKDIQYKVLGRSNEDIDRFLNDISKGK